MDKRDREIVDHLTGKGVHGNNFFGLPLDSSSSLTAGEVHDLIDIIKRLDKQLTEIVEVAQIVNSLFGVVSPIWGNAEERDKWYVAIDKFAEVLRELKDEKGKK